MQGIVIGITSMYVISVSRVIVLKEGDNSLRVHGDDDEELRMLASLKREQEEDECRASGFSASQIHQCNVSISVSSDDASTWTHIFMVCAAILCDS